MAKDYFRYKSCYSYKLIYIFAIDDLRHKNLLKIGETTIHTDATPADLPPCCNELNNAARQRIDKYTRTAAIAYDLLYTELAIDNNNEIFGDSQVHAVLTNSNIKRVKFPDNDGREWFNLDIDTAVNAVDAVKHGRQNLSGTVKKKFIPVIFRPEQEIAVKQTVKQFRRNNPMLWNAKMRFGKTLCALEVVRRMNFKQTIIITHRPVVNENWYDDFNKIFGNTTEYLYGSKNNGNDIEMLINSDKNFVYFASMQDLRGSEIVGGNFDKNEIIFNTAWDCCIVDEAHEGTTTAIGDKVIKQIIKEHTKTLALSGTPFNILSNYDGNAIYTWDYIMEQDSKTRWDIEHFGDSNPYGDLPRLNIYTFNLGELLNHKYISLDDKAFNFAEFFRTDDNGKFIHAADVNNFLNLITKRGNSNYPFANDNYRRIFNHTLWMVPGVRAGRALSELLQNHPIFSNFKIVNVAGDGDADEESRDALKLVKDAISNYEYTITISCGKLTTGVTIPEWTAVFMLAGSYSTSAASYLQTIFRVQSPCKRDGKIKTDCYVFDFAPDRTLRMVAESVAVSTRAGKTTDDDRVMLQRFLQFCPVIAIDGTKMLDYNVNNLLQQLKHVYIDRVVKSGFEHFNLYNDNLLKLDELQLEKFETLRGILGTAKSARNEIVITKTGTTKSTTITARKHKDKTAEDIARDRRRKAISILRAISIRIPLLIFGADVDIDEDFTIEMLTDDNIVDDASWREFMPNGVTKDLFKEFIQFYDREIFAGAARRIRDRVKAADNLTPTARIIEIANLFACFKNPDKETVLTPWRVVNIHMSTCFGGWDFFDENHAAMIESPRKVTDVTDAFNDDANFLEVNAKTGLYPLYAAYSICRNLFHDITENDLRDFWDEVVRDNIFVLCKTPMAASVTRRTLVGFRNARVNTLYLENLIGDLNSEPHRVWAKILNPHLWNKEGDIMKFDIAVGNPPYQEISNDSDNKNFAKPVYHHFIEMAMKVADKASLIHPARCLFNAGATPKDWTERFLNDEHVNVVKYSANSSYFFNNVDIKGGIAITYFNKNETIGPIGLFFPADELRSIHDKVVSRADFKPLSDIVYPRAAYRFAEDNSSIGTNAFDKQRELFFDENDIPDDGHEYVKILGRVGTARVYKYIRRDYICETDNFTKYKVFIPSSNGSGSIGEVLSTPLVGSPLVGSPLVGSTETFTAIGSFDTEFEATAVFKYVKTKFARALLGILKVTQHNPAATWAKVPQQDFSVASDIDWSVSVAEIDRQLYEKYLLNDVEIEFIERNITAMD